MKKTTLYEYSKTIIVILVFSVITSFFGVIQYLSERTVNVSANSKKQDLCIIIDAGHGGEDGGAVGTGGTLEKNINFAISSYLFDMLDITDLNVVMTRTQDKMLYQEDQIHRKKFFDLKNRVEVANDYNAPLFISIHQNKFPIEKYNGLQVYYSGNNKKSLNFATIIQEKTKKHLQPYNNRKEKVAGKNIYLLDKLTCPAVIVECGFLSNPAEEKLLCDSEYQKKIAFIIFSSIMDYIDKEV